MIIHILRPVAEDFSELNDICFKTKKHWGYPDYLIEIWNDQLTITPRYIRNNEIIKIQDESGKILAFGAIKENESKSVSEIQHFWILPEFMQKNVGKILLARLEKMVKEKSTIKVVADPNMKSFFQQNGYHKVGESKSKPDGLKLPILKKIVMRKEN